MKNKPRKWWVAGLLSFIQPGLGHVYNGQLRKAIAIYVLPLLIIPWFILCLNTNMIKITLAIFVIVAFTYYLFVITDAIRTAKKRSTEYCPHKFNNVIVYIGLFLSVVILSDIVSTGLKSHLIQAFKIPASSMIPTALVGDHILVDRREAARNPKKGDLIVFIYPQDESKDFIKRVVAVAGETVEIRNKFLFINDRLVKEPYVIHRDPYIISNKNNPRDNFGPVIVPPESYFVLGDNRDQSFDSRFWGFVKKSKIKGTVKSIYWSWDSRTHTVRWDRIGKDLSSSSVRQFYSDGREAISARAIEKNDE